MKSRKPSAWKLIDFLSFGLIALLVTGFAVAVSVSGPITTVATGAIITLEANLMMWAVALAFWGVYFMLVYKRHKFLKPFTIETKHGLMVYLNGYDITKEDIEKATDDLIDLYWSNTTINAKKFLEEEIVFVKFEPEEIGEKYGFKTKVMGFANIGGGFIVVSYARAKKDKPLVGTAFKHELGHIIIGRALNNRSEKFHHDFMIEHKVP